MADINKESLNKILRRRHLVQNFENVAVGNIGRHFAVAKTEILGNLDRLQMLNPEIVSQDYRMRVLVDKLDEVDFALRVATKKADKSLSSDLYGIGVSEKDFEETLVKGFANKFGIGMNHIPINNIMEMIETPLGGATFHQRMLKNYGEATTSMKDQLIQSVIQGEDMKKATARLVGVGRELGGEVGKKIVGQAEVIARTEIQRVANSVAIDVYSNNQDIIKGVMVVETLDPRTCVVCGSFDGKIYLFRNGRLDSSAQIPPYHPHCRGMVVPITKSWEELGAKGIQEVPPSTRASFQGQVPAKTNYADWLSQMNLEKPKFVQNILGKQRYALWSSGQISFNQLVSDGRLLPIKKLDKLTMVATGRAPTDITGMRMAKNQKDDLLKIGPHISTPDEKRIANETEEQLMAALKWKQVDGRIIRGVHSGLGNKPYDGILGNQLIEVKTLQTPPRPGLIKDYPESGGYDGRQTDARAESNLRKKLWRMKHARQLPGMREWYVVVDMDPNSPTYKTMWYAREIANYRVVSKQLTKLKYEFGKGGEEELNEIMLKGAKPPPLPKASKGVVPKFKNISEAKAYALKNFANEVDFGGTSLNVIQAWSEDMQGVFSLTRQRKMGKVVFDGEIGVSSVVVAPKSAEEAKRGLTVFFNNRKDELDPGLFSSVSELNDETERQFKKGYFSTGDRAHVVRHEIGGHANFHDQGGSFELSQGKYRAEIVKWESKVVEGKKTKVPVYNKVQQAIAKRETKRLQERWQRILDDIEYGIGKQNIGVVLSDYALENPGELWAEMKAKEMAGELLHPTLIKVMEDMEKWVKAEVPLHAKVIKEMAKVATDKDWYGRVLKQWR